jgi:ribonuclease BN (tRNA processing enzyme)
MRLTVVGKSPAWQDENGACSSYLLEQDGCHLLLDCGNGAFAKLRRFVDYLDVTAVVLSHMHADHFLDLIPYSYALTFAPRQQPVPVDRWAGTEHPARPLLYTPPGGTEVVRRVVGAWGSEDLVEKAFRLEEYAPDGALEVGPFRISFAPVPHFTATYAISVESDGARLAYGADSGPAPDLVEFARDADVFLIEATLPRPERDGVRGHLTPAEAGEHGRAANAKRLVLTHISDELDLDAARQLAAASFGGPVEIAAEGAVYEI